MNSSAYCLRVMYGSRIALTAPRHAEEGGFAGYSKPRSQDRAH